MKQYERRGARSSHMRALAAALLAAALAPLKADASAIRLRSQTKLGVAAEVNRYLSPQEHVRDRLSKERKRTLAQARSLELLRESVKTQISQLPLSQEIQDAASKVGEIQSMDSVEKATATMNTILSNARLQLDQKMIECRTLPDRLRARARETALQEGETATEIAFERSIVANAAARSPVEAVNFREMKSELAFEREQCVKEMAEFKERRFQLTKDEYSLKEAVHSMEAQCNKSSDSSGLLQMASDAKLCNVRGLKAKHHKSLLRKRSKPGKQPHPHLALLMKVIPSGCSMTDDDCAKMQADLEEIQGEVLDNTVQLKQEENEKTKACEVDSDFEREEMTEAARHQADFGEELSGATAKISTLSHREKELEEQRKRDEEDIRNAKAQCDSEVHQLLSGTVCGLTKVRDSMWLLAGATELPLDCEVTDWADHPCSATCGKGTRESTREVIVEAQGGVACPPLKMYHECEEAACPTDCTVSEWSGWSACSAVCDNGIQERTRAVLTEARNGGDACPQLVESQVCSREPCSRDCELSEWSEWSACSKMCGGGTQSRQRSILKPPIGSGTCTDDMRAESQSCNPNPCATADSYTCAGAKEDIVLLVDSSSALTKTEFEQFQKLSEALIPGYDLGPDAAKVAVLGMSRSTKTVSGMQSSQDSLTSKIQSDLSQTHGATKLGGSMNMAQRVLLREGRRGVFQTVVVLTRGGIADPCNARQQAQRLKQRGVRLMFVVIGEDTFKHHFLNSLVSRPSESNLLSIEKLDDDNDVSKAANKIIAATCSAVV